MSSFFHSIRWRVQVWHGLILLVVLVAFCLTAHRMVWQHQLQRIDENLIQTERSLVHTLMNASGGVAHPADRTKRVPFSPGMLIERLRAGQIALPAEIADRFQGTAPGYAYFSLRDAEGRVLLESSNAPQDLQLLPLPAKEFSEELRFSDRRREMLRSSSEGLCSLVGLDLTPERENMNRFTWSLSAVGFGVWLLGLIGGWWLAGRAIRPIEVISATATHIADGNLAERIGIAGTDSELDQLSHVLNRTFDRLHGALEQQKQFTADASHELRTPVTILLAETQRILKRERTAAEYREVIETCRVTTDRMRGLIEALLLLAREEAVGTRPTGGDCDLARLLQKTAAELERLAADRHLTLRCELQPAVCAGDAASLAILAANLVRNAIQHHDLPGGTIHLASAQHADHAVFTVRDDGPGIPSADLPNIFERFYRADKARTGNSGHAGLGLAIARTIAANHGGTIVAANNPDRGACFTVTLPGRRAT